MQIINFMYVLTDSIEFELKEVELEVDEDWIFVAQGRDQLLACRNVKVKLLVA